MEKAFFVKVAPAYYELAIVLALQNEQGYIPEFRLRQKYMVHPEEATGPEEGYCLLDSKELMRIALHNLIEHHVIEALIDPFGPSQYREGSGLGEYMNRERSGSDRPLFKAEASGDADRWLKDALEGLDKVAREIGITAEDFQDPEREWAPLPLDRSTPELRKAIETVDETVSHVEQNNGYGTEHPEEKRFVLDNLKLLSATLKNAASTSVAYIRTHGLNVLQKLQERFGTALIGEAAKEASKALWTFIKEAVKLIV